jgi:hypothetical protein
VLVAWHDAHLLLRYPFAVGIDGFYYAEQVKSILANHTLYYPSRTPLVFYLIAGICRRQPDIVRCIKLTAVAIEITLFLGFWALLWRLTRSLWMTCLGASIICLLPSHLFLVTDFIKELLSLALLTWSAVLTHLAVFEGRNWLFVAATVLFLFAALSHISALLLLATVLIGIAIVTLSVKRQYLLPVVVFFAWSAPFIGAVSPSSLWFLKVFDLHLSPAGTTWWTSERLAVLIASVVILVISAEVLTVDHFPRMVFQTTAFLALCITANPGLAQNSDFVFGRASMTTNCQLGVLVSGLLYCRREGVGRTRLWPIYGVLAALVCLAVASPQQMRGLDAAYLRRRAELVRVLLETKIVESQAIVIAPQGDQFVVTYITGRRAQHNWTAGLGVPVYWVLWGFPIIPTSQLGTVADEQVRVIVQSDNTLREQWLSYDQKTREWLIQSNPELMDAGYSD